MAARITLIAALAALPLLAAPGARAQMDSREGIALQNQILELRRDMDALRRGGGAPTPVPRGGGGAPPETVQGLLGRVAELEEMVRRQRGQLDVAENANRRLAEEVEKLRGDMDFRLQQLEGGGRPGAARPPQGPPPAQAPAPAPFSVPPRQAEPASPPPQPGPRTAERALADGQAALSRGDFPTAEAAAREVIAQRPGPRAQDASLLLGEALLGRRQYQNAALAFDEAYRRNRQGTRAPEALLGLSNAFIGFGARREACDTLEQLTAEYTRLAQPVAARVQDARRRAQCR
ncbi:tetratricopeptide repeat protein [Roseomonas sp. CECT 9278]|uniref:tetratricopeptide repeat protein n=1 Tax=Roseomonas sp. CECT 9278 TaxID=2845823 RepID=UPI001E649EDA|nr:tetratricopeptide repeat protein [Roseomonas sp. CECT 9278]CAH0286477.1 Cell division coordinator CpoB [Roseomonas sp. CECT 9278]